MTRERSGLAAIRALRVVLFVEAAAGVALAVLLSFVAAGVSELAPDDLGADVGVRFVAAGAFLASIAAAIAARGARSGRAWAWTLAALIQLAVAIGTGVAVLAADWHPAYMLGFGLAALIMVVLSTPDVRRALGQE